MAHDFGGRDVSFIAYEDLSSYQYHFVTMQDQNNVRLMDGATEFPIGVLQNAPEAGEAALVRIEGTSKLKMNAALAVTALVKAEYVGAADTGKGDAADTEGDIVRGVVIVPSGAEDDVGTVLLCVHEMSVPA